jgi:carbonic anhydrase/acetyltransferase-like protein (isoleucine patch superfamily)
MHAYLLNTGRVISPFEQPVGEMRIHDRRLHDMQEQILRALGCTVERIDDLGEVHQFPCLLIYDDLYFTYYALAGFLKAATQRVRRLSASGHGAVGAGCDPLNAQAALVCSELTERFSPAFQGTQIEGLNGTTYRSYNCFFLQRLDAERPVATQAELVPIPHKRTRIRTRANRYFEPSGKFVIPVSRVFMAPVQHWASLVAANLLGMPGFFSFMARRRPLAAAAMLAKLPWRAGSLRPSQWRGKLYLAGPKCQVHPSAHVEGAILGRRVIIGPNAVVRGAVIGDETQIGPGAVIEGCTVGERAMIDSGIVLRCCSVDDDASIGVFFCQLSVIGQGAVMCPDSGIFDFQFNSGVRVGFQGRTTSSGSRLLGGCLGHRAFLGAGVKLLCGQEVPNDCVLIESPRRLVRNVDEGLPEGVVRMDKSADRAARRAKQAS